MRGRKPKPTQQQINEGDPAKRGKKKLVDKLKAEPKTVRGLPAAPAHLSAVAKAAWKFWKVELEGMQLDSRPDAQMLEGACVNYARAVEADRLLAISGILVVEPIFDGERKVVGAKMKSHPAVAISNSSWRNVRAFCSEFGLSPVSRTRLTLEKAENPTDDLLKLLSQPRVKKDKPTVQ